MALCLICGRKRVETVCGDQSCPCSGGRPFSDLRPVVVQGLTYTDKHGQDWTVQAPRGRLVPTTKWRRYSSREAVNGG